MEVKSEHMDEGKSSIENGVYSVKVNYDIKDHYNFLNLAGCWIPSNRRSWCIDTNLWRRIKMSSVQPMGTHSKILSKF